MFQKQSTCPRNLSPAPRSKRRSGFALIVAIALLAFMVMLILSLSTMLRSDLQVAAISKERSDARQNALLALEIALGQLQQYAGADQRVTTTATTVYPNKDVTNGTGDLYDDPTYGYRTLAQTSNSRSYLNRVETYLTPAERDTWAQRLEDYWNDNRPTDPDTVWDGTQGRNPYWTAVFDSSLRVDRATEPGGSVRSLDPQVYEINDSDRVGGASAETTYGEPDRHQLPVWLVSGNEQYNFDPRDTTSYPSGYYTPDQPLTDADKPVVIVGLGSATLAADSSEGLDGRVSVPRQELLSETGFVKGHYAYWVGDESTKANFTVLEPESYVSATPGSVEYRNRLQVPQRIGWERMEGFDAVFDQNNIDLTDLNDPETRRIRNAFDQILGQRHIQYLHNDLLEPVPAYLQTESERSPVARNFHNITAYSRSLFTDTALGGLKQDLTRYLRSGTGLRDDDPIADLDRYENDDPRFAAWGGDNDGFPSGSAPSKLDGIPTWQQIRDWYDNDANQGNLGSIQPDAETGTGPVISYIAMHGGLSYHGPTQTIRWHWMPVIVLWNPYDVGLTSRTYELDMHFSPELYKGFVCNPNPSLSELQAIAGLNGGTQIWTDDPDKTVDDNGDGNLSNDYQFIDTNGNAHTVYNKADADTIDFSSGPWVADEDVENGVTDAFGRIFYYLESADPSSTFVSHSPPWTRGSDESVLGNHAVMARLLPHHDDLRSVGGRAPERVMRFNLNSGFDAGEAKVFTLQDGTNEWRANNRLSLINDYLANAPTHMWFDVMRVVNGPSSAEADGLRWCFEYIASNTKVIAPAITLSLDGEPLFETLAFGNHTGNSAWDYGEGRNYNDYIGYTTNGNDNLDGDGQRNRDEAVPKFIDQWRRLYDFANFDASIDLQEGSKSDASNFSFFSIMNQPFLGRGTSDKGVNLSLGSNSMDNIHSYSAAFSRFNFGASYYDQHPLVEAMRSKSGGNNYNFRGQASGLIKFNNIRSDTLDSYGSVDELSWIGDHTSGTDGYAMITPYSEWGYFNGLNEIPVRNARRAQSEILSLGQLQQVNLSRYYWQPAFPIGNSYAPPYTDREAIAGIHSREVGTAYTSNLSYYPRPSHIPNNADQGIVTLQRGSDEIIDIMTPGNTMMDLSYLLNENLWDRFFLSSIQSRTFDLSTITAEELVELLPNTRHRFRAEAYEATANEVTDFDLAAAYMENVGALNVNSTSVEAWKALLTAFRDLELGGNPDETVPVSRTLDPIGDPIEFEYDENYQSTVDPTGFANNSNKDYADVVSGTRYLTDGMIDMLARRIVDEVRLRGPFYSMSDFVNRRLVAPQGSGDNNSDWVEARTESASIVKSDHVGFISESYDPFIGLQGLSGTIQRALQVSGINGGVNDPRLGPDGSLPGDSDDMVYAVRIRNAGSTTAGNGNQEFTADGIGGASNSDQGGTPNDGGYGNFGYKHTQEPSMRSHLDSEHVAGAPAGEAGQLFDGAPGFVTQGDILAMIGPALTARGDTFVIRTYGDSINPLTGETAGRAWLEAVVQRSTEPVEPLGTTGEDAWQPVTRPGRKFEIVTLRWLTEDEI